MVEDESESDATREALPKCPNGLFNFSDKVSLVTDADEEILELYMNLANTSPETSRAEGGGLGFLDSSKGIIDVELELLPTQDDVSNGLQLDAVGARKSAKKGGKQGKVVSVQIQQDLGALKSRKGDTGSVLWRSSLHLAKQILTEHHFPPSAPLLDPARLAGSHILELGAGTGLLAILLAPLCASYTASDRLENLRLVQRNLEINHMSPAKPASMERSKSPTSPKLAKKALKPSPMSGAKVQLEEVDWVAVSAERSRQSSRPAAESYDLILAVDCIFNENLVQPLVDTLAHYCIPGRTVVWVVVELRSADVLTLFLETWLHDPSGPWVIIRLGEDDMGKWGNKRGRWVGWVGWRASSS